jgi:hypothetical protein
MKSPSENRHGGMIGTVVDPKSVHFDDLDNRTQHFFQADRSMAVVANSLLVYPLQSEAGSIGPLAWREISNGSRYWRCCGTKDCCIDRRT